MFHFSGVLPFRLGLELCNVGTFGLLPVRWGVQLSKGAPTGAEGVPKAAQECPRMLQGGPKGIPQCAKGFSRGFQWVPTVSICEATDSRVTGGEGG